MCMMVESSLILYVDIAFEWCQLFCILVMDLN